MADMGAALTAADKYVVTGGNQPLDWANSDRLDGIAAVRAQGKRRSGFANPGIIDALSPAAGGRVARRIGAHDVPLGVGDRESACSDTARCRPAVIPNPSSADPSTSACAGCRTGLGDVSDV